MGFGPDTCTECQRWFMQHEALFSVHEGRFAAIFDESHKAASHRPLPLCCYIDWYSCLCVFVFLQAQKSRKCSQRKKRWRRGGSGGSAVSSHGHNNVTCSYLVWQLWFSRTAPFLTKNLRPTRIFIWVNSPNTLWSLPRGLVFILINVIFLSVSLHYYTVLITELGLVCREAEVKVLVSDRSVLEPHCGPQTLQKHQKQQWQVSICRPEGPVYGPGVASVLLELNSKLVKKQSDASFCGEGEPVTLHSPWTRVFGNCVFVWS